MHSDMYKQLGLDPKAEAETIRGAINRRIRELQPILTGPDSQQKAAAQQSFQFLMEARGILLNEDRRREYDRSLSADQRPIGGGHSQSPERMASSTLILFDATASMIGLWSWTAQVLSETIARISGVANVKLKCCAYRDYCDGRGVFESSKWSSDAEPLVEFIKGIRCMGGGDFPEAVELALQKALKEKELTRIILIGDAPPHPERGYREYAAALGQRNRPVFAFRVDSHPETEAAFREIAQLTGGHYADLRDYRDLMDLLSLTVLHDAGGVSALQSYATRYGLTDDAREFLFSLPTAGN